MAKSSIKKRLVDVRPDRIDVRDRRYRPPLVSLPAQYPDPMVAEPLLSAYRSSGMILDQGLEGACTGFGLAAVINYLRWTQHNASAIASRDAQEVRPVELVSPRMIYHLARIYDEWDGEDYDGSSCRGAMKGWHRHGVCTDSLWPYFDEDGEANFVTPQDGWVQDAATRPLGAYYRIDKDSVTDMQAAVHEVGAIYCSAMVHDNWDIAESDSLPVIRYRPRHSGGHAFAIVGYTPDGFIVQNSWGTGWGYGGFAVITYEEWVANGMDTWVAVMGAAVRLETTVAARSTFSLNDVAAGRASVVRRAAAVSGAPAVPAAVRPLGEHEAQTYTLVLANDGQPVNRLLDTRDARDAVARVARVNPARWLERRTDRRVAIYAHGGLNNEDQAIDRAKVMAPYFLANGIYPLFVAWRTGVVESLTGIVEDALAGSIFGPRTEGVLTDLAESIASAAAEAKDRTIEVGAENLLGKAIWQQMKQNAAASVRTGAGVDLLVGHLRDLREEFPDVKLHLVGHSAGSILLGYLLRSLQGSEVRAESLTLYAPACTTRFAVDYIGRAIEDGALRGRGVFMEILDDERERADSVGPYGKSLLYLVSRALEDTHKTPLLGMEIAAQRTPRRRGAYWSDDALRDVADGNRFLRANAQVTLHGREREMISDGVEKIRLAHGSFDNDIEVLTRTLRRIRGGALQHQVVSLHGF